jgi:hypothetical protein
VYDLCVRVVVAHPSRRELTMVRNDDVVGAKAGMVETVEDRQVRWLVMLESAKD